MNTAKSERIYQWWLTHKTKKGESWSYAAIARMFRVSREWVRVIIERENKKQVIQTKRAYQIAAENMNAQDSLKEK